MHSARPDFITAATLDVGASAVNIAAQAQAQTHPASADCAGSIDAERREAVQDNSVIVPAPALAVYKWSGGNQYFMISSSDTIAMGGGYISI